MDLNNGEEIKKKFKLSSLASFVSKIKKRTINWAKDYREAFIAVVVLIVAALFIGILLFSLRVPRSSVEQWTEIFSTERHPLTGEVIENSLSHLPQVFGIMVENSKDAWPLSGLDEAFLVIEAPVEANIPRFVAFFSEDSEFGKIGPVRSTRAYYLDWNDALQAVYGHVGGSPEALELISSVYETIDLNQFWQSEYFYRQTSGGRYAPHNVYTTGNLLISALDELSLENPVYSVWEFKNDSPVKEENAVSVEVDFADGSTYDVLWEYQSELNSYLRYQAGDIMLMEDDAKIYANNVVVIATDIRVIDNEGRKSLRTTGEGDALIIQDGEAFVAKWKKEQRTDRIKFFTYDGYEIAMNAGVTWIEVVDDLSKTEIK
ncbi:DUF3048 domain-containing protein [Patescibacteria group bacterium]|nr:DUF3048 domain-containing protein [Patescibacteria group bacterium]